MGGIDVVRGRYMEYRRGKRGNGLYVWSSEGGGRVGILYME